MTATKGLGTYGNGVGTVTPIDHKMAQLGLLLKLAANTIRAGVFWDGNPTVVSGKANMSYDVRALAAVLSRGATAGAVLLTNDGVFNVVTTAAPGSNSRYDVVYLWQREYSLDGTDSNPVIGVVQGTAAASPTVPSLAAFPGAIELARILVPAGVTATNSGTTITQTAPFTTVADGTFAVRNGTELAALGASYVQGQQVLNLATGVLYAYFAAFDATTNPQGAKTAGWYPVEGGAKYGGKVVHGASSPTFASGDTVLGGATVWSATAAGASKELGIAAFGGGTPANAGWTVSLDGVYRITAALFGTTSGAAGILRLKKNNQAASGVGAIAAAPDIAAGVIAGSLCVEMELVSGDYVVLTHYNGGASAVAAIGANTEDLQFGIEFVRPIRHA